MGRASLLQKLGKVSDRRSELVKTTLGQMGVNVDELAPQFRQARENLWNGSSPTIRTDEESLPMILQDGRFKNYLETGRTNGGEGSSGGKGRRAIEDKLYGKFENDSDRPIYGYMEVPYSDPADPTLSEVAHRLDSELANYGSVKFYPKKDFTRKNSTYTLGDSQYDGVYPGRWDYDDWQAIGAELSDKGSMSVTKHPERKIREMKLDVNPENVSTGHWAELQYPGGVSLNDIASVTIPEGLDESVKQAAIEAANKYGFRLDESDIREIVQRCLANCIE